MLSRIPQFDYAYQPDFSYYKWLETRSHSDVIVKAIELDMIERSGKMDAVIKNLDTLSQEQRAGFEAIGDGLSEINDTLTWGFMEVSEKLSDIALVLGDMAGSLDRIAASLDRIEAAVTDTQRTWALANLKRANAAIKAGYIKEAIDLLKLTLEGGAGHDPYTLDPRFHYLIGSCYAGNFGGSTHDTLDLDRAITHFEYAVKYTRMTEQPEPEFVASCLTGAAWSHYCIGNLEQAAHYYSAAMRMLSSFVSEYGLAKALLSQRNFHEAQGLIRYCLLKYRSQFLKKAASDPNFIAYKDEIVALRESVLDDIRKAAATANAGSKKAVEFLKQAQALMGPMEELTHEKALIQDIVFKIENFSSGASVESLSYLEEGGNISELENIQSSIDSLNSIFRQKKYNGSNSYMEAWKKGKNFGDTLTNVFSFLPSFLEAPAYKLARSIGSGISSRGEENTRYYKIIMLIYEAHHEMKWKNKFANVSGKINHDLVALRGEITKNMPSR